MIFLTAQKVIASPVSPFTQEGGTRCIPVDLKPFGHYFILRTQPLGTHAGILDNSQLAKILGQFPLRLNTTLIIPASKGNQQVKSKSKNQTSTDSLGEYRIRIAIHGLRRDKETIGKLLSNAGLFLQHPSAAELIPEVEYDNPHYLLRPGAEMPAMEDLSMEIDEGIPSQNELEDETGTSNLLQIFESAAAEGDPVTHLEPLPSPRLCSSLMV